MRKLLRSRRGSVAFATVVALVPLIGALALGAEAGSWYVTKQQAQNAADAAAYSGGLTLACALSGANSCDTSQDYAYRGKQFAAKNTFCNAGESFPGCVTPAGTVRSVQIDRGAYAGNVWTSSASGRFVRAVANHRQSAYMASLLGLTTVNIGAQSIVEVRNPKAICAMGLGQSVTGLTIGGGSTIAGSGCALMSDSDVKYSGSPNFAPSASGWAVNAVNGCTASAGHCDVSVPYNYNMLPASNPLLALDSKSFNSWTGTNSNKPLQSSVCPPAVPAGTKKCYTVAPNSGLGSGKAYSDLTVGNGDFVTFASGTYFFYNAAISITGGSVTCGNCAGPTTSGVTLVLLGDSSIKINGGTVSLYAPNTNSFDSALSGVLIDDQASAQSKNAVTINGGTTVTLGGIMYFPHVAVTWGGTAQNVSLDCTEVIANSLTISGSSYLSSKDCAPAAVPKTQVIAFVK